MIYVAGPYSHPDLTVREKRFDKLTSLFAHLAHCGVPVYSPISMTHPMTEYYDLPTHFEYWRELDTKILSVCSLFLIYTLDGWALSKGVQAEMIIAGDLGIPIMYITETYNQTELDSVIRVYNKESF